MTDDVRRAMLLSRPGAALRMTEGPLPHPHDNDVRLRVLACGVCRTDLHLIDGELPSARYPVVPGHEIVGTVDALGSGVSRWSVGQRVGVPWLGGTCHVCPYCASGRENLCDAPTFTGCERDGGYATHVVANADYCLALDDSVAATEQAPLLCAGLIGWRTLKAAGDDARRIGLYGFGAASHLIAQVAIGQGREVYAFTRAGDRATQAFARSLGARWAGASDEPPPVPLDAALIFAPAGELVPAGLRAVRKGGRVVCGGIHMSDIPGFPYADLWGERRIESVANLTRADGTEFFAQLRKTPVAVTTTVYPLDAANEAIADVRAGRIEGAAVLVP